MKTFQATGFAFAVVLVATGFACGGGDANQNATSTGGGGASSNSATGGGNGGNGGAGGGDGFESGTRLKQKWLDFGGARVPDGIFDAKLQQDCAPTTWTDESVRCTPRTGAVVFTDAGCQKPLGKVQRTDCAADVPPYFADTVVVGCDDRPRRIYREESRIATAPAMVYYRQRGDDQCVGPTPAESGDYYEVGAAVNAGDVARLTTVVEDATGRYARQTLESDDGYRGPSAGAMNKTLAASCSFVAPTGGKSGTCQPDASAFAQYFGDASCSKPVLDEKSVCVSPVVALTADHEACSFRNVTVWKLGGALGNNQVYSGAGAASCELAIEEGEFVETDGKIELPAVARAAETRGGRPIESIHYTDGGTSFLDGALYDPKLALECRPAPGDDGTTRCVPDLTRADSFYTTSDCQPGTEITIAVVALDGPKCQAKSAPSPYVSVPSVAPGCDAGARTIHRLGGAYDEPLYQPMLDCKIAPAPEGYAYHAVGEAVPATEFLAAKSVTDP